jgi:hypothetical protein
MSLQKNKRRITMKLENINFNGKTYKLRVTRYSKSNFVAILMNEQGCDDEYPYPNVITTNNSVMEKDENDDTEYIQIRTDNPEYVKLLVENGLIEERPDFIMPQGYIGIMFFAPTEEFANYIKENVKP